MNPDLFEGMDLPPACAGADGAAGADAADAEAGIGEPDDNVVPFVPASGD
jgi:hypothetical protein